MANQIAKDKQQISLVLPRKQVKRLDGLGAETGKSRAALISEAIAAMLDGDGPSEDASDSSLEVAKLETIIAKLDGLASKQDALATAQDALKSEQLAQATVIVDAVKNQPIAVQQPAELPAPEVTEDDVREYIEKHCPDAEFGGVFGETIRLKKKGFFSRFSR